MLKFIQSVLWNHDGCRYEYFTAAGCFGLWQPLVQPVILKYQYHFPFQLLIIIWWRHQMETFSALLAICAGNSPVPGEFPAQRPVTRSFDVFFDLRLNKRLSKHSWGWWFETLSRSLWRHRNEWSNLAPQYYRPHDRNVKRRYHAIRWYESI